MWDASELDPILVEYYIQQAKKFWPPKDQYRYQEDIALQFLHMMKYSVADALLSIIYDKNTIIKLIKTYQV